MSNGGRIGELAFAGGAGRDQHVVALVHAVHDVVDRALDAFRCNAIYGVVFDLLFAPPVGFLDGALH